MQIRFNTDDNVEGRHALAQKVTAQIEVVLGRFSDQIPRIEVHLSDENAGRSGASDKRCAKEARPAGRQPLAVTHQGATLEEAYRGPARKPRNAVESMLGKLSDQKGTASFRDNEHR